MDDRVRPRPALGGDGSAPSPSVLVRAALGSCMAMTYRLRAARAGVELTSVRVTVETDSELAGMLLSTRRRAGRLHRDPLPRRGREPGDPTRESSDPRRGRPAEPRARRADPRARPRSSAPRDLRAIRPGEWRDRVEPKLQRWVQRQGWDRRPATTSATGAASCSRRSSGCSPRPTCGRATTSSTSPAAPAWSRLPAAAAVGPDRPGARHRPVAEDGRCARLSGRAAAGLDQRRGVPLSAPSSSTPVERSTWRCARSA